MKSTSLFPAARRRAGADGMALALTLALSAAVVLCVLEIQLAAALALRLERRKQDSAALRACASSAAWLALRTLAADTEPTFDHTNKPWAAPLRFTMPDDTEVLASVVDENRRYNINNLAIVRSNDGAASPEKILARLIELRGYPDAVQIAARIARSMAKRQTAFGRPPLESLSELDAAAGLSGLASNMTGLACALPCEEPEFSRVNINTAEQAVLEAVLGEELRPLAAWIVAIRETGPFVSLSRLAPLQPDEKFKQLQACLDTRSVYFSVHAQASKNRVTRRVYALAKRLDDGGLQILRWITDR